MNKGVLLGIIGGVTFFVEFLLVIMYINSDCDQKLIEEVDSSVSAVELITKKRVDSHSMDSKDCEKGSLALENDYGYYIQIYEKEMRFISD